MSESFSHVPADTQAATRDLQERLARFARNLFVVSGIMLVASIVLDVAVGCGLSGLSRMSRSLTTQALVGGSGCPSAQQAPTEHKRQPSDHGDRLAQLG